MSLRMAYRRVLGRVHLWAGDEARESYEPPEPQRGGPLVVSVRI